MQTKTCPVSELVPVLNGKWMFKLFVMLTQRDATFGQLKGALVPITNKVLTQHLQKAVKAGCVEKTAEGYALTAQGAKVVHSLRELAREFECKDCKGVSVCLSTSS
ncbi:helix-turn-helix transcriptional regulator [Candidatus Woesearchaeota archaeon]|nr:helix-turn-helix transcriptional regulator [Candidatus Woesearchaeota archaeon]